MKTLVFIFVVGAVANCLCLQLDQQEDADIAACAKETGVSPSVVEDLEKGMVSDDKNAKCFYKCTLVKSGDMTEAGDFVMDSIKKGPVPPELTQDQFIQLADTCTKKKGTDACDTAYIAYKCFMVETVKMLQG